MGNEASGRRRRANGSSGKGVCPHQPCGIRTIRKARMDFAGLLMPHYGYKKCRKRMRTITSMFIKLILRMSKLFIRGILLLIGHEMLVRKKEEVRLRTLVRSELHSHMNEFLGIIGHDIKTPLTSIKGNIQLISRRLQYTPEEFSALPTNIKNKINETQELLERTNTQVNRLARLVNGLLESTRIQTNTMDLLYELCELNQVLCEIVEEKRGVPAERALKMRVPEGKAILVMADINRIKQVIMQYLSNAHKYSGGEHPIEMTLHEDGHMAHVHVRDKGQGIPHPEQRRIWERYYQVPGIKVLNGSEVGLGLGLHVCKSIIERHNGKVGVLSAPGQGSTFWFSLPLAEKSLMQL